MQRGGGLATGFADSIWFLHAVITLWVAFGWVGPNWMAWGVVFFGLAIEVQWFVRKGWCVLGDLEIWLRAESRPDSPQEMGFVKRLFKLLLRIEMSAELGYKITHIWIKFSIIAAVINLLISYGVV